MRKILLLTIPHDWLTVENAAQRIELIKEAVYLNRDKEIIIISGVFDHGYKNAYDFGKFPKGEVRDSSYRVRREKAIFGQIERYLSLERFVNDNLNTPEITDRLDEVKKIVYKDQGKIWINSGIFVENFCDVSFLILKKILSDIGLSLSGWPKDIITVKSSKIPLNRNSCSVDRISSFLTSDNFSGISAIFPSYSKTLSGIPIILNKNSLMYFENVFPSFINENKNLSEIFMLDKVLRMDFFKSRKPIVLPQEELAVA